MKQNMNSFSVSFQVRWGVIRYGKWRILEWIARLALVSIPLVRELLKESAKEALGAFENIG